MPADVQRYRFEGFTLLPGERQLLKGGAEVVLRPKAFDTLLCLVEHHGHAVSKARLLDVVWPETNVSEAVLTHCVAEVRQALSDEVRRPRFVKTISRHGYKFIAGVAVESSGHSHAEAAAVRSSTPPASAIVVLPFANISADPENEFLCDGLSEELINGLTKVSGLHVVAHSSSFSFKGRDIDAREIGRQLNVGTILEGSVRKTGDRLRVSAQLIDAARGYHLWCEQYDRRLEDIFAIQDEISQAIVTSLKVGFLKDGRAPLITPPTASMDAYVLYLQGRAFWHQRYGGHLEQAMECFGQAIAKDPGLCLALRGARRFTLDARHLGLHPRMRRLPEGRDAGRHGDGARQPACGAVRVAGLDPPVLGLGVGRGRAGVPACARAEPGLRARPGLVRPLSEHRWQDGRGGRRDGAGADRSTPCLPCAPRTSAGRSTWRTNRVARSTNCSGVLARNPANGIALFYLGYALIEVGRYAEAIDALRKAHEVTRGMPWSREGIGLAHGLAGQQEEARAILAEVRTTASTSYVPASAVALVLLGLGDEAGVLDCLERGVEERDVLLPWLGFLPCFDRLHQHPRFQAVIRRIGLA